MNAMVGRAPLLRIHTGLIITTLQRIFHSSRVVSKELLTPVLKKPNKEPQILLREAVDQDKVKILSPAEVLPTRQFKFVEEKAKAKRAGFNLHRVCLKECVKIFRKALQRVFLTTIMLDVDAGVIR